MRSTLNSPYPDRGAGVLNPVQNPCRTRRACLSLPLRRALRRPSFRTRTRMLASFFGVFSVFSVLEKTVKKRTVKKSTFSGNFGDFGASDVDFRQFLVSKQVPGGYFFGVFLKTVILSKSCSRCRNNRIFKGRTLQKSVRRATPNGNREKKRQKPLPATSPDVLFRPWTRF